MRGDFSPTDWIFLIISMFVDGKTDLLIEERKFASRDVIESKLQAFNKRIKIRFDF